MATKQAEAANHLSQSQERIDGLYHEQFMKDQIKRVQSARKEKEAEKKPADETGKK